MHRYAQCVQCTYTLLALELLAIIHTQNKQTANQLVHNRFDTPIVTTHLSDLHVCHTYTLFVLLNFATFDVVSFF